MSEPSPETVGAAMRLAMAVLACKPDTNVEHVYCVAECATGNGGKHIAKMSRIRGEENVVVKHVPIGGVTLCGAKLGTVIHPYQTAKLLTTRGSEYWAAGCPDCVSEWLTLRGDLA